MPDVDGLPPIEPMIAESASCCGVGAVAVALSDVPPPAPDALVAPDVPVPVVDVPLPSVGVVVVLLLPAVADAAADSAPACCNELYKPLGVYTDTPEPPPSDATIADCDDRLVAIDDKEAADVFGTTSGVGW